MPTYEYFCSKCDKDFLISHPMSELKDNRIVCDCDQETRLERKMSAPGIKVRGGTQKFH